MLRSRSFFSWLILALLALLPAYDAAATSLPDTLATRLRAAPTDTARLRLLYRAVLRLVPLAADSAVAGQLQYLAGQAAVLGGRVGEPEYQLLAGQAQVKIFVNLKRYRRAAAVAQQLRPLLPRLAQARQRADLYATLATGAYYLGDWKTFTANILLALRIQQRLGNQPEIARLLGGLTKAAIAQGDFADGLTYTRRALALYRQQGNRPKLAETYTDLGSLYLRLAGSARPAAPAGRGPATDSARACYGRAIAAARALGDSALLAMPAYNLAGVYWARGELLRAEALIRRAVAIARAQHNNESLGIYATGLASVYIDQGRYPAAERELLAARAAAARLPVGPAALDIEQAYADLYERAGQPGRALGHLRRYLALHDSLFSRDKAAAIAELRVDYEAEQQAQQIQTLEAEARSQRQRLGLLGGLALAVIAGLAFLYRGVLLQKRLAGRNQQLAEQQQQAADQARRLAEQAQQMTLESNRRLLAENALEAETTHRLQADVAARQRELLAAQVFMQQKNDLLGTLQAQLLAAAAAAPAASQLPLRQMSHTIRQSIRFDDDWERIKLHFEGVHPDFFRQLQAAAPALTDHELRHCAYIKMKFATKEIAVLLGIDGNSVKVARYRLKKKLDLAPGQDVATYLALL